MTIPAFLARLSGGDLPADAVREERCLKPPIGCGKPLISPESVARLFRRSSQAAHYDAEWRITGLCPDCQDALDVEEADL